MYQGTIFNIMIGSPGDVSNIALIAIKCIQNWNILHSNERKISLIPHHWTSSTYPSLRKSAQEHIDALLVENSDALIAIFGSRLGTPTDNYRSGTVEEIEQHLKVDKPVMVFFCERLDANQDIDQLKKIQEYRANLKGLYEVFRDESDFEKKFVDKLQLFIQNELIPVAQQSNCQDTECNQVSFTEEEMDIIKDWCNSNTDFGWCTRFKGGAFFRFGNLQIETDNLFETTKYNDIFSKFLSVGLITENGFNQQGNIRYRLTSKAFELLK